MSLSTLIDPFVPLIMGAIGVLMMFPVTLFLYRRFLAKPIATKTKTTFVEAADDENFVNPLKDTLLWRELSSETAKSVGSATSSIAALPQSIREAIAPEVEAQVKTAANHMIAEFEKGIQAVQTQVNQVKEDWIKSRRFAGDPAGAQAKGVETKRAQQIVQVLDDASGGGATMLQKCRNLADVLSSLGEDGLADWIEENPEAIPKVERLIRSNPRLAARLKQFEDKLLGDAGATHQHIPGRGGIDL